MLTTKLVGANESLVTVLGDPSAASQLASVLALADALNPSGYALLAQQVPILFNGATYDRQRAAPGTTGIAAVSIESTKATYSNGIIGFTPAATATDFWALIGATGRIVRLLWLRIGGVANAAISSDVRLIKRSTLNTLGTPTDPTIVSHDANDAATAAIVRHYGANPGALGTSLGQLATGKLNLGVTGAAGDLEWDWTNRNDKAPLLRTADQMLCLNWNGAAVPAGTLLAIECEFTDELA